jgi:hypothetical protein
MSTVRRVCWNVKRWRSASMAMRWTAAAMQEAARQPALAKFYNSLGDEQKARFNSLRSASRPGG